MARTLRRPLIVSFEGIDGCGKSTQARAFAARLRARGRRCVLLKEPGVTPAGERIRTLLLRGRSPISPWCELFLYLSSRAQLAAGVLAAPEHRGAVIVLDRYVDSTVAYQGYGRGLPLDFIAAAHRAFLAGFEPAVTFVLDADPKELLPVLDRKRRDRMERESLAFQRRVRAGYLAVAAAEPGRVRVIPRMPPAETAARIFAEWERFAHDPR